MVLLTEENLLEIKKLCNEIYVTKRLAKIYTYISYAVILIVFIALILIELNVIVHIAFFLSVAAALWTGHELVLEKMISNLELEICKLRGFELNRGPYRDYCNEPLFEDNLELFKEKGGVVFFTFLFTIPIVAVFFCIFWIIGFIFNFLMAIPSAI